MWRKLLSRAHPDGGGEHELFVWATALKEHVCGGAGRSYTPPRTEEDHTQRTRAKPDSGRVPFEPRAWGIATHRELIERAMELAEDAPIIYRLLIGLLEDCYTAITPQQEEREYRGASYKQLARIAHQVAMSKSERVAWYRFCERIPMSQRMAGHILGRL
jgi:hypothetical protein